MSIAIINGPNLNLLGEREPLLYGSRNFEDFLKELKGEYKEVLFTYFQSNIEGEIIDELQSIGFNSNGIILNAGGYTHTSVAIADAVKAIKTPVIEVHISNIISRENYRHTSLTGANCIGTIMGLGLLGYKLAIDYFIKSLGKQ
ncbi:MAG: 3-dehydroquinate dehydratase [Bacteroidia bacterium]|nr:3-dehydroquinate dehydratase [Bacteroidia bacterium]MCZ2247340.1 3-dehydroquinate dehydratase [Bacteroidia bacterium]